MFADLMVQKERIRRSNWLAIAGELIGSVSAVCFLMSPNFIEWIRCIFMKGYRYEFWCLARATSIRYCEVFCDKEVHQFRKWNEKRDEINESSYDTNIVIWQLMYQNVISSLTRAF